MILDGIIIAIDFDGTCVTHDYPKVGKDIGAQPVLKRLVAEGAKLILWTMRSGQGLKDAEQWFKDNDIPLYGVQKNPTQNSWTNSPKAYAKIYIDDAGLGCPLINSNEHNRPYVDWNAIENLFFSKTNENIEVPLDLICKGKHAKMSQRYCSIDLSTVGLLAMKYASAHDVFSWMAEAIKNEELEEIDGKAVLKKEFKYEFNKATEGN